MHIFIAGNGNMATGIINACRSRNIKYTGLGQEFDHSNPRYGTPVAIHFGSGRELPYLIKRCEQLQIPIIQGSTKLTVQLPSNPNVVIINAPNLSLPMIRFITSFPEFAQKIRPGMKMVITESHQSTKADTSGTARAVTKALGIPDSEIKSIREPEIQLALGVPEEHLAGHAYHDFTFIGQDVEIKVTTKIRGRAAYINGALALASTIAKIEEPLINGVYELRDLLPHLPEV
jgi:4-hydroxy-tetrahydrodipicolinate reductase